MNTEARIAAIMSGAGVDRREACRRIARDDTKVAYIAWAAAARERMANERMAAINEGYGD